MASDQETTQRLPDGWVSTTDAAVAQALIGMRDRLAAAEALIRRLDWPNIHTHYGFTATCEDCNLVALLTQSQAVNG